MDYNRYLVITTYKTGRSFAAWYYSFSIKGSTTSWRTASAPYDDTIFRKELADCNILLTHEPVHLNTNEVESHWVHYSYEGADGDIQEE